jgi:hypothetical protein
MIARRILLSAILMTVSILVEATSSRARLPPKANAVLLAPCSNLACSFLPLIKTEPKVVAGDGVIDIVSRANERALFAELHNSSTVAATDMIVTANIYTVDLAGNADLIATVRNTPVFTYALPGQIIPFQIGLGVLPPHGVYGTYTSTVSVQARLITETSRIVPAVVYTPIDPFGDLTGGVVVEVRNDSVTPIRNVQFAVWSLSSGCGARLRTFDTELQPGGVLTEVASICTSFTTVPIETIRIAAQAEK